MGEIKIIIYILCTQDSPNDYQSLNATTKPARNIVRIVKVIENLTPYLYLISTLFLFSNNEKFYYCIDVNENKESIEVFVFSVELKQTLHTHTHFNRHIFQHIMSFHINKTFL